MLPKKIAFIGVIFLYSLVINLSIYNPGIFILSRHILSYRESKIINIQKYESGIEFSLPVSRPYLGIIELEVPKVKDPNSEIIFTFENEDKSILAQSKFQYFQIKDTNPYPLGIPVKNNSENKKLTIKISFNTVQNGGYDKNQIQTSLTYIYPKSILLHPKYLLDTIKTNFEIIFPSSGSVALLIVSAIVAVYIAVYGSKHSDILPIVVLVAVGICSVLKEKNIADKLLIYFYISIIASISLKIFKEFINKYKIKSANKSVIISTITIFIVLISFSSWYFLGGDETRIYYLYPEKYLSNYVSNIIENTTPSNISMYVPVNALRLFVLCIKIQKFILPFVNTQIFLFCINLLIALIAFYKMCSLYIKRSSYSMILCGSGAFLYVFSIFNAYTIFNSQNYSQYLLSIFPVTFILLRKFLDTKKYIYIGIITAIYFIIPIYPLIPILGALIIGFLPVFIQWIYLYKKTFFTTVFLLSITITATNIHWLGHLIIQQTNRNLIQTNNTIFNIGDKKQNSDAIISTSKQLNPIYPFLHLYPYDVQKNLNWPQLSVYESWYLNIAPFNFIFIVIILVGLYENIRLRKNLSIYISFVFVIFYFCGNLGFIKPNFFAGLVTSHTVLLMFRNMYDKFALPLALIYALCLTISLDVILRKYSSIQIQKTIICTICILIFLNIFPVIDGRFQSLPIWGTSSSYSYISKFNRDYINLAKEVESLPLKTKIITLPLSEGNLAVIDDDFVKKHYYVGVSPMLILSGKNDVSGFLSFGVNKNLAENLIESKQFKEFGYLLKQLGITHIVMFNNLPKEIKYSNIFTPKHLSSTDMLFNTLVGKKIKSFGNRYSLYEIKDEFKGSFFTVDGNPVEFNQIAKSKYLLEVPITSKSVKLSEYINPFWTLEIDKKRLRPEADNTFGMNWTLPTSIKNKTIVVNFLPQMSVLPFWMMSFVGWITIIIIYIYYEKKYKKNRTTN